MTFTRRNWFFTLLSALGLAKAGVTEVRSNKQFTYGGDGTLDYVPWSRPIVTRYFVNGQERVLPNPIVRINIKLEGLATAKLLEHRSLVVDAMIRSKTVDFPFYPDDHS